MGPKKGLASKSETAKGLGEASRRKMVKERKGWAAGEKRVAAREDSVAEKRWVRRSKTAIWWISLWMWGTSEGVARRMRVKRGVVSGNDVAGSGAGVGAGGGAAAAIG